MDSGVQSSKSVSPSQWKMSLPHYCPKRVHCSFSLLARATPSHCHLSGRVWRWSPKQRSSKPASFPYLLQCSITLSPVMFPKCKSEFAWFLDPHPNAFRSTATGLPGMVPTYRPSPLRPSSPLVSTYWNLSTLLPSTSPQPLCQCPVVPQHSFLGSQGLLWRMVKNLSAMQKTRVWSREDPPEKEMATYSSILAWEIPWTEEPGGLRAVGSQRIRHDWATNSTPSQQSRNESCFRL